MKTFKPSEYKTFEQLAMLSQEALWKVMGNFLKRNYKAVVQTQDYIFAEGDIPVCLVAHMDTVFKTPPEEVYFDPMKNVVWSPDGLGADDRAGVFAITQIIRSGLRPHVIFTTNEESGGIGARSLARLDCPFPGVKYFIELDRRGSDDCVFYDCDNEEFVKYVEDFGFCWAFGTYTDICDICSAWEIAGVNLSIGYRDEHSVSEVLFVGHMLSTIEKVKCMLADAANLKEPFKYIPSTTFKYKFGYGNDWYSSSFVEKCHKCKHYFLDSEMMPVLLQNGETAFYCGNCLENVSWCKVCGTCYEKYCPEEPNEGLCPHCLKKEKEEINGKSNKANK